MYNIKEMISGNTVQFNHYRAGNLWYEINWVTWENYQRIENTFNFPVPIEDTAGAVFQSTDKAMLFMRFIRKHIKLSENEGNE